MKNNKEKEILITVIVPCYNAEKYINKCIDSILNQSFKNFELICVNDGSTDTTLDILKEYEKNNSNMLVVSKKNEGGKNVTKTGLKYAKGKYICAIDNDDYIEKDYLKELYNAITKEDADIAICGFQREDFDTAKVFSLEMNNKTGTYILNDDYGIMLEINTALWNKLFKREVMVSLLNYRLDALGMGDMTLLAYMYQMINKISFTNKVLYHYRVRKNSGINTMKKNVIDSIYDNLIRIKESYANKDMYEAFDAYAFLHLGVSLMYWIYKADRSSFNEIYKNNLKVLNENFPKWKKNKYYSLKYVIKNKGRNLKLHISYVFYRIGLFKLFIKTYGFITNHFKFDIKW